MDDLTLVIFGASGDLTRRLLMPSIYQLEVAKKLPPMKIVGFALEDWDDARFKQHIHDALKEFARGFDEATFAKFAERLAYRSGDLVPEAVKALVPLVPGRGIFYFALPPSIFGKAAQSLGAVGLADEAKGSKQVIVEKPLGFDRKSSSDLNAELCKCFQEHQILRIDHFLGKETVQNLMVFRFANRFVEPIWNSSHVDCVQITVAETLGLEGRYRYYDHAGALRDMVQNHLMQLLAVTAIEPPAVWESEILRDHKGEVLQAIHPICAEDVDKVAVRGRYTRGRVEGKEVPGYLEEPDIPAGSRTETFAALKLHVDTWRWKGVPFYLRTGKRLAHTTTEIAIKLKEPPTRLFHRANKMDLFSNWLLFQVKPEESIDLYAQSKRPGLELNDRTVRLHAPYHRQGEPEFSAYEQLILDAIQGDRTHFLRFDEVDLAWKVVQPILDAWATGTPDDYAAGSDGPATQSRIIEPGHDFRPLVDICQPKSVPGEL
ncbi:MAG TPA: glucose-6-phosphate dehydrogenase [Byssovorax sp.]